MQPWIFTVKKEDVKCMTHILNLAVQDDLNVKSRRLYPTQTRPVLLSKHASLLS